MIGYLILSIYLLALIFISVYCLVQFNLLLIYHNYKKKSDSESKAQNIDIDDRDLPFITIQLPIYNEQYVVERLIDNITNLDYPIDKMEIHVIDDSTDNTRIIAQGKVEEYKHKGFLMSHITREERNGYKAGALRDAMAYAKGEFIVIFDADFLPNSNFLKLVLPFFNNPEVGVVQTRWEHINENYSLLTRLQAFQLNVHFTVEQKGRDAGNLMLQFNGTAGIWRKETIDDAGGWEADTLTEDLDLSYRAQLKGWKIVFRDDIAAPAELPSEMNGLKSQQFRWMKGGAETAKKILPAVWRSPLKLHQKFHATIHLLASSVFLFVFILGIFSVPALFYINPLGINTGMLSIFMVTLLCIIIVYFYANMEVADPEEGRFKTVVKLIFIFPIFLSLSMGLSLHNSMAVLQGFIGKKSPFVRTPKFNIQNITDKLNKKSNYMYQKMSIITIVEGLLAIYFVGGLIAGFMINNSTFFFFHLLLVMGYSTIFLYSMLHRRTK